MASALTVAGKDEALNALRSVVTHLSVHSVDDPVGDTTEPVGGLPAYARKPVTWAAVLNGVLALVGTYMFDIPPGFTVKSVGMWSADTGGTFYGYWDVVDEAYAGQGVHTLTSGAITL